LRNLKQNCRAKRNKNERRDQELSDTGSTHYQLSG
jgi:hypothetical protein